MELLVLVLVLDGSVKLKFTKSCRNSICWNKNMIYFFYSNSFSVSPHQNKFINKTRTTETRWHRTTRTKLQLRQAGGLKAESGPYLIRGRGVKPVQTRSQGTPQHSWPRRTAEPLGPSIVSQLRLSALLLCPSSLQPLLLFLLSLIRPLTRENPPSPTSPSPTEPLKTAQLLVPERPEISCSPTWI